MKNRLNLISALALTSMCCLDSRPEPNNYHSDIRKSRNGKAKANRKKTKAQRIARRINRKRG